MVEIEEGIVEPKELIIPTPRVDIGQYNGVKGAICISLGTLKFYNGSQWKNVIYSN